MIGGGPVRRVRIESASREIEVPAGQTVLEAALAQGIAYPHGCRSGRCGSCKSRLVSGEVDLLPHTPFSLREDEKERGLILACRAQPKSDVTLRWLAQEPVAHPIKTYRGAVVGNAMLTHDIIELRIATDAPMAYAPGQYASLSFPGLPSRDYSMAPSADPSELVFHIRQVPDGRVSSQIARRAKQGQTLSVTGPFGSAYLREDHTRPILAVAGGSGLAPILTIVERAVATEMNQPIHLYHGVRGLRDCYGQEEIADLVRRHRQLTYHSVFSGPPSSAGGRLGFVHEAIAQDIGDMAGWKLYMAGPPVMVEAVGQVCLEKRLRSSDIHADVFYTPEAELGQVSAGE